MQLNTEHIWKIIGDQLECKKMADDPESWIYIENCTEYVIPVSYTYNFVLYQNAYYKESCDEYINFSIILYNKKQPIGIWPLAVSSEKAGYKLSGWDTYAVLPPVIIGNLGVKGKRKIFSKCIEICEEICKECKIDRWLSKDINCINSNISLWMRMLLEKGSICSRTNIEAYVDLKKEENDIFSSFRKSYKSCITHGKHLWSPKIISKACSEEDIKECFEQFEKLHIEVAGRRTRSHETWALQSDSVKNTNDFVILLFDEKHELVGASLYSTSGTIGYYGVGVYKRNLFEFPLAHVSQWEAIRHMKQIGLKWYHLGTRFYDADGNHPTSKELSIAYFKEGFATSFFPSFIIDVTI